MPSSALFEDKAEIAYVSYDDQSRCYFYGIRVVRSFRLTGEKQVSQVKRRRFREFAQLITDYGSEKRPEVSLPSKFFSTAPDARKPQLERFLNALIKWDVAHHKMKMSPLLERFLGLDSKHSFPPKSDTFDEFEKRNPMSMDETKQILAGRVTFTVASFFVAFHLMAGTLKVMVSSDQGTTFTLVPLLAGILSVAASVMIIWAWNERDRAQRKRAFELEQQLSKSTVKLEHKPVDDLSISKPEAENLPKLRERLVDFASGTTPEYDEQFLKGHGAVVEGLLKAKYHGRPLPEDLPKASQMLTEEARKIVWEESVLVDHRLVPFLRFNGNNLDKAESQARFAMTARVALGLESIICDDSEGAGVFRPPTRILAYGACPLLRELTQRPNAQRKERLERWWLRDRDGCLCMFARLGHMPSGLVFEKGFNRDADLMNLTMIWFVELFKRDLDAVHEESKGRIKGHCTVVADMAGFDLQAQLGTGDVLNMVKKYVPLMAPTYGGLLKRYIIINAPWYVNMLLAVVRPFIPADILDSLRIHSGFDKKTMLDPFIEDTFIPKYLGGSLTSNTDPSDAFCRDRFAPFGPFEPDKGESLLALS